MNDILKGLIAKALAEKLGAEVEVQDVEEIKLGPPIALTEEAKVMYREYLKTQNGLSHELRGLKQRANVLDKKLEANKAEFFDELEKLMPAIDEGGHGYRINPKEETVQVRLCDTCDEHPLGPQPEWVKDILKDGKS